MSDNYNYNYEQSEGDYTRYMRRKLKKIVQEEKISEIRDTLIDDESFRSFSEELTEILKRCGYSGDEKPNKKAAFLYKLVKEIEADESKFVTKETLCNWFKDKHIPFKDDSRSDMLLVCFALGLTLEETEDFFRRVFLGMPFNFRDKHDCICYYCLKNNKPYSDVKRLENMLSDDSKNISKSDGSETKIIRKDIHEIDDEDELLDYISKNISDSDYYFRTARSYIKDMKKRAMEFSPIYSLDDIEKSRANSSKEKVYEGINGLMRNIYGLNTDKLGHENPKKLCSEFPKELIRNLPKQHEFGKILKDETKLSSEMLRKCLIILNFYITYRQASRKNIEVKSERFRVQTNNILMECGFSELYLRNPFDYVFFYCSMIAEQYNDSMAAIQAFHGIIDMIHEKDDSEEF